jgi:hypothetical protein
METNKTANIRTKWNHFRITYISAIFAVILAVIVFGKDFDFYMLASQIFEQAIFTLIYVMFGYFWRSKYSDVDVKIYNDSIATAIYLGLFGVGSAIIWAG